MEDTIFHKILRGDIPSYKVYEDEDFFAFLDIYPRTKGHTLLIPKVYARWTYEVKNFGAYWETARKISIALQKGLHAEWVNYFTFGEIPYAHIHILPRYGKLPTHAEIIPAAKEIDKKEAEEVVRNVIALLQK